ncbi:hypothetical protein BS78_04G110400 [Paspalum vaginatum]|nr:hypothetical protein BS78_04G110400 [Paspalum vaginatum]
MAEYGYSIKTRHNSQVRTPKDTRSRAPSITKPATYAAAAPIEQAATVHPHLHHHQDQRERRTSRRAGGMPCLFPAVPPALAAADGSRTKKRAGLPKLLHKLFIKVLRLSAPAENHHYGYRMGGAGDDEEYCCCCYSYGGAGSSSSWAGVLCSIPEEDYGDGSSDSDEGTPDVVAVPGTAALRKAKSERFVVGPPDAAAVVHVEVLL